MARVFLELEQGLEFFFAILILRNGAVGRVSIPVLPTNISPIKASNFSLEQCPRPHFSTSSLAYTVLRRTAARGSSCWLALHIKQRD